MKKYFFALTVFALFLSLVGGVQAGYNCQSSMPGLWSNSSTWTSCGGVSPGINDIANILSGHTVSVNANVTVDQINIASSATLNNFNFITITLMNTNPFAPGTAGTFTSGTPGSVELSDADHTLYGSYSYFSLYINPLTSPRTITIGAGTSITVTSLFLSGSSAANKISFISGGGTGTVANAVTSYYCASNGGITNITCISGGPMPTAPDGLTAGTITQTSVVLNWNDNSSNETGFNVYDGATLLGSVGVGVKTYTANSLTCNTNHTFTVKATNGGTESAAAATSPATTTTSACAVPVTAGVSIVSVSNVKATTALATGTASGTGITERGFFWWIPPTAENHFGGSESGLIPEGGSGAGSFSLRLTDLKPGNTYHVKAYVKVGGQIITSDEQIFTTATTGATGKMAPTVLTDTKNFTVSGSSITVSGEITDVGTSQVNVYGFAHLSPGMTC